MITSSFHLLLVCCITCLDKEDQYQDFIEDLEVEVNGFQNILNPDSQAFERRRERLHHHSGDDG